MFFIYILWGEFIKLMVSFNPIVFDKIQFIPKEKSGPHT